MPVLPIVRRLGVTAIVEHDRGIVRFDARGDLPMTSEVISPLSHTASSEAGGIRVLFRIPADNDILDPFYRREPL